jgi:flagellar protein FliS
MTTRGIDSYRRTEIESRTPLELVVMLYDGALRFIGDARAAMERNDVAARRTAISRALAIIAELQSTLDMEGGASIASSLDGLYSFVTRRLMDASFEKTLAPLDDAVRVLTTLRDAWAQIAVQPAAAPVAQAVPTGQAHP